MLGLALADGLAPAATTVAVGLGETLPAGLGVADLAGVGVGVWTGVGVGVVATAMV
jgi:hypothetical protein